MESGVPERETTETAEEQQTCHQWRSALTSRRTTLPLDHGNASISLKNFLFRQQVASVLTWSGRLQDGAVSCRTY